MSWGSERRFVTAGALGGMGEAWQTRPPYAERIVDMRYDPLGFWRNIPGYYRVDDSEGSGVDGECIWFQWFSPKGGRERYPMMEVATSATTSKLGYVDLSTTEFVTIASGRRRPRHPWQGQQPLEFNGWLYLCDGVNAFERWSPEYGLRPVGFNSAPGSPVVHSGDVDGSWGTYDLPSAGLRGLGSDTEDERFTVGYAITAINDLGQESPPSNIAWATGKSGASSKKAGVYVRTPRVAGDIREVRLWRTYDQKGSPPSGTPPLYLRARIYHGGGCDLLDFALDEELGELLDTSRLGLAPLTPRSCAIWQQTMFVIDKDATSLLYSDTGFIEQFPLANSLPVSSRRAGPLTSLHVSSRGVFVVAERAVYMVKGDPFNGFRILTLAEGRGTRAGRAVVNVPGGGLAFLDPDSGPQLVVGQLEDDVTTRVVPLGPEVQRTWQERVNREILSQARATIDPRNREVWWHLPEGGSQEATLGIVFHYEIGAWSLREDWDIGDLDFDRGRVWFGGQDGNPGLFVISPFATTKGGTSFTTEYRTAWYITEGRSLVSKLRLQVIGTGNGDVQIASRIDRRLEYDDQTVDSDLFAAATEYSPATWEGSGVEWSATEVWGDYVPIMLPVHMRSELALEHQFRILSDGSTDLRLLDMQIGLPPTQADPSFEEQV